MMQEVMTDKIGLELLKNENTIFKCILKYGYSIDCMLPKYKNVDWTDSSFKKKLFWHNKESVNLDIVLGYVNQYS